jgi:aryl sulfotransferase
VAAVPLRQPPSAEDSGRWLGFPFRPDDIVISTPRKSGTTWMQMICALLIFQTPALPAPLWRLSLWLDAPDQPAERVAAELAAQRHRRFIKTHTPLAGIPFDARVTYVVTARHPVDAFVSMYHQNQLLGPPPPPPPPGLFPPHGGERPPGPPPPHGPPPAPHGFLLPPPPPAGQRPEVSREQLHAALIAWIGDDGSSGEPGSLPATLRHLSQAWGRRDDPNVVLVHYDDLLSNLDKQMRHLADRLGIGVAEPSWPALVEAATFRRMRDRDDVLVPPPPGVVPDNSLFFRRGTSGAARELLTDQEMAWYHAQVARLAAPDLIEWLHRPAP